MGYKEGEVLIAARVAEVSGFSSTNVKRGAWGVLNSGNSDHYAILRSGGETAVQSGFGVTHDTKRTVVEIWQRLKDDATSADSLYTHAENVKDYLKSKRKMGDSGTTVFDSKYSGMSEAKEMWTTKGDAPSWLKQEIYIDWSEEENVTYT